MIVFVIGPPLLCQVFSFGDAKVSKKKYAMLILSFCFFLKKSYIFGQLDGVLRDMVPAIGGLLEVFGSRGLLKIFKKKHKIIDKMNKLII